MKQTLRTILFGTVLLSFVGLAPRLQAGTILSVTSGTGSVSEFFGESFTTPSGGPWNSITFNFYSDAPGTTPAAAGTAFLLSSEYLGTPGGLSSSTPGFIASTGAFGNVWGFAPGVTLNSNTEYWIYENVLMTASGSGTGGSSSGEAYFSSSSSSAFSTSGGDQLANFTLSSPAPEPGTVGLTGGALFGLVLWSRRRRILG